MSFQRNYLRTLIAASALFTGLAVQANPPSTPQPPQPQHQRKVRTRLTGVVMLPRSDWEKRKFNTARVGDFVEYQTGDGVTMHRRTVEEVGDHTLVVKETKPGKHQDFATHISYSFELPDQTVGPGNSLRESNVKIDLLGKHEDAELIEIVYHDKPLEQRWYCDDVPLGGLVKHVSGGTTVKQVLTAYGRAK